MSSNTIYGEFTPTYLYIKQHTITGMFYFGKTIKVDPVKYLGSGSYWAKHLKKYGKEHVVTLWYELFTNKDELISFATSFSQSMDIVKSNQWANLVEENGLDGGCIGMKHSEETLRLMSVNNARYMKGKKHSPESIAKQIAARKGVRIAPQSEEHKAKIRAAHIGMKRTPESIEKAKETRRRNKALRLV